MASIVNTISDNAELREKNALLETRILSLQNKISHLERRFKESELHWKHLSHAISREACFDCDLNITTRYTQLEKACKG